MFFMSIAGFSQRLNRLDANRSFSLYGGAGYPYQSAGISVPLPNSTWSFRGQFNTDLGGIVTNLENPDNQFIGALTHLPIGKNLEVGFGAGINLQLHTLASGFGITPVAEVQMRVAPFMRIGASYMQPTTTSGPWNSQLPIIQASGYIDINWYQRTRGLTQKSRRLPAIKALATTGIQYTTAALEISQSYGDQLAFRGQIFTDLGNFFESPNIPDVQWVGMVYRKPFLQELTLKAGAGLSVKAQSADFNPLPYFFIGGEQYLFKKTYLVIEIWQPTRPEYSQRRIPFVQVGLALDLI